MEILGSQVGRLRERFDEEKQGAIGLREQQAAKECDPNLALDPGKGEKCKDKDNTG